MVLKFKLRKVTNIVARNNKLMNRAYREFFENTQISPEMENFEETNALFNEWIMFEFQIKPGLTPIIKYFLENHASLPIDQQTELEQIVKTQRFCLLEVEKIKRGEWIQAYSLYEGVNYRIYDKSCSQSIPGKGTIYGRVAKINNQS